MSDILYINGEDLDVKKVFDVCVIEGFEESMPEVGTKVVIVPTGSSPAPSGGIKVEILSNDSIIAERITTLVTIEDITVT